MINATAGTITVVKVVVNYTPLQCYFFGENCIREVLCNMTQCIITNSSILIEWIW